MKSKKLVSFLLVLVMIVGMIPNGSIVIDINAATTTLTTRAQWVQQLTETFEMTVDENQYPDNYYSDVDETSEYYDSIMLATAFGVIDIEAGKPFNPNGAITREFAVHTLNFCMGYQLEEGETYTFSDSANCEYPDDAQIAINRGWVSTVSGKFSPTTTVTAAEINRMLQDAEGIVESENVDENYASTWDVASGVIEVPYYENVTVEDGTVTIVDSSVTISKGDTFVIHQSEIAVPYKALNVTKSGDVMTITTEDVTDYEDAFDDVDAEGVIESDELTFEALDGTELDVVTTDVVEGKARATKKIKDAKFSKSFKLSGNLSSSIKGTFKNIKVKYNISTGSGETFVQVEGDLTMTGSIAATASTSIALFKVGVPGIGGLTISADLKGEGKLNSTITTHVVAGLSYSKSGGFRAIRSFKENGGSNTSTEATASMGVTLKCGITDLKVISGYVYAKAGVRAQIVDTVWTDGQPRNCKTFLAFMYASYGAEASCKFVNYKYEKSVDIYNLSNSPMRIYHHYEDGTQTATCARGQTLEYFTKYYSSYWGSGWSGFDGCYGLDGEGKPYQIYEYSLDGDNNATITKYYGNVRNLVIPETLDGYAVVGIGRDAFKENNSLVSVQIPEGVRVLGCYAFGKCNSLVSVSLPKDVQTGEYAGNNAYPGPFYGCSSLKEVTFAEGTTIINNALFECTTGLEIIDIPDTVTSIGWMAFAGCTNLKQIVFSDNLKIINSNSFQDCENLTELNLPDNLEVLGCYSFGNCVSLTSVYIPKNVQTGQYAGNRAYPGPFSNCSTLKEVKFAEGTTVISNALFWNTTGLETINIPDTVTSIGWKSFASCSNLKKVIINENLRTIGESAFAYCSKMEEINIPKSVNSIGSYAFQECESIKSIFIPKNVSCGNSPFSDCSSLKDVTFEEGITTIPSTLFYKCTGIEKISLPEGVEQIGNYAFSECTSLTSFLFSSTVSSVGNYCFMGCTNLTSIEFPKKIQKIENHILKNCTSLEKIIIPDGVTEIKEYAFENCGIKTISLPTNLLKLGKGVFYSCALLEKIELPNKIGEINYETFAQCISLQEVIIPNSVKAIYGKAFQNCDALRTINIPNSVTSFDTYSFQDCDTLTKVQLGTGITQIPSYAFEHCDELTNITIPYAVSTISNSAFANCIALTNITIPRTTTSIDSTAFSYPAKMTINGVAGTYAETFANEQGIKFINNEIKATDISIDKTSLTINKGFTERLSINVTPNNFTDEVQWKSTDVNIVTVDSTGLVSARGVGSATVKVTVGDISANCKITVVQPVTSISLNKAWLSLDALEEYKLNANVYPDSANNKSVEWKSSNPEVAIVDENGNVTALSKGTATITVSALDGSGEFESCTVTVTSNVYKVDEVGKMESGHPYDDNCTDVWTYTLQNANNLKVTFSSDTEMEDGFDYLYIIDANGNQVGKYTGTELAGQSIVISGNTVKIKLDTDNGGSAYGFKLTDIVATNEEATTKPTTVKPSEGSDYNVVNPAKVSLKNVKNIKGKKAKLTWTKITNVSGYQIQYSTNKKFKKGLKTTTAKANAKSKTIKKLKKKKTYYFRIRAYKVVNGNKVYGKWSNKKKVKIKK